MIGENWEVNIRDRAFAFETEIFIYRNIPEGRVELLRFDKKGNMATEVVERYASASRIIPPTFLIPTSALQALFEALQRNGMKPTDQSFVEGKLKATEDHLKDMRELVFNPDIFYGHDKEVINVGVPSPKEDL